MHTVAVIVGSIRKDSINKKLAGALAKLAEGKLDLRMIRIDDLPLYNPDDDDDLSASVRRFKEEVEDIPNNYEPRVDHEDEAERVDSKCCMVVCVDRLTDFCMTFL